MLCVTVVRVGRFRVEHLHVVFDVDLLLHTPNIPEVSEMLVKAQAIRNQVEKGQNMTRILAWADFKMISAWWAHESE